MSTPQVNTAPFLSRYAIRRDAGEALPGYYDQEQSLWMVETDQGAVPLVAAGRTLRELETKTKVNDEQDDTATHALAMTGTTHTSVSTEQDDATLLTLLAVTITEVKPEADDQA